ncbi:MAG: hypothetical protein ACREXT_02425 [Gammaproteobacteria bacterium]
MQTQINEVPTVSLANLVHIYAQRIEDRRQRLRDDLAYYSAKLDELDLVDPQDCTGLRRIYSSHLDRTSALLRAVAA